MLELLSVLREAELVVNDLVGEINSGEANLEQAERRVVEFVNRLGGMLTAEVLERVAEPTTANTIYVGERKARYKSSERLELKTRFGTTVTRRRRRYAVEGGGNYYPLDEQLGLGLCGGFTPLVTYLLSLFGSGEPYEPAADRLSAAIGFDVSATAVQNATERVGAELPDEPSALIEAHHRRERSRLMIVETDGTVSPQIREESESEGRESLKEPTEYKECNLVAIEKRYGDGRNAEKWVGARYGPRREFEPYLRDSALALGQLEAEEVVFLADGARHNWEMQRTNFPEAVAILDFYHALEHLGEFCALVKNEHAGKQYYARWREKLYNGEVVPVIAEMNTALKRVSQRDEAQKHINYFQTNRERMAYDEYRARGYPIGSGMVEGACKYVVGKRFKGSGMRWKRRDNQAVLNTRLHVLNHIFESRFRERSLGRPFTEFRNVCQEGAALS